MGRFSRNRTAKARKRGEKGTGGSSSSNSSDRDSSGGGSLMSMREGLKSVAGTSDKPPSKVGSIMTWIVMAVLVLALISFLFTR